MNENLKEIGGRNSFSSKYAFTIMLLLSLGFFVFAGLVESYCPVIKEIHLTRPLLSSSVWLSLFILTVLVIFRRGIKASFNEGRVFKVVIEKLASMRLAVYLMALATLLVFVGTIAQAEQDVWEAVGHYFRCFITRVPLSIFIMGETAKEWQDIYFFLPGGYLLGFGLLVNLLAAHGSSFKINAEKYGKIPGILITFASFAMLAGAIWLGVIQEDIPSAYVDSYKRVLIRLGIGISISVTMLIGCILLFKKNAGLVILHFGIILLLVSELVTGVCAIEANMNIREGESTAYVDVSRQYELAITDLNDSYLKEKSFVISGDLLRETEKWYKPEGLPFEIKVTRWHDRATIEQRRQRPPQNARDLLQNFDLKEAKAESGNRTPGAIAVLRDKKGREFATVLLSLNLYYRNYPQQVFFDNNYYNLMLRPKRNYLYSRGSEEPFSLHLVDFRYDRYVGTNEAKNFSSLVHLVDKSKGVDRKILISMNNPLRYSGRTFYQSSFFQDETGTVLSVVENPGWMIPYICCMLVGIGMLFHFSNTLVHFVRFQK